MQPSSGQSPPLSLPTPLISLVELIQIALDLPGALAFPSHRLNPDVPGPLINRHRLGAFLYHHLPPAVRTSLPSPLQEQLSKTATSTTHRALIRHSTLLRLGAKLTACSIPWLTVKGPVLANSLWQGPGKRHAGDVDIVIHSHDAFKVDSLLCSSGFRRTLPDFDLTPRQGSQYIETKYEFGYQSITHPGLKVEIKWRLDGIHELGAILDHPHLISIAGKPIPTLPPALNFRYLCHHGARHGWLRLFWLVDVSRLIQQDQTTWSDVLPRGQSEPSYRSIVQAMGLIHHLFGLATPPGLLPPIASEDSTGAALQSEAIRQIALPTDQLSSTVEWLRQLRYRTQLEPGRNGFTSALRAHVFSPLNWQVLKLPDRWFRLYPFLSPFLWIYRLVRRRIS